jgi:3D (Asp-Asp-Asp) domain-containing protein
MMGERMHHRSSTVVEADSSRPSRTDRRSTSKVALPAFAAALVGASLLTGLGIATGQVARSSSDEPLHENFHEPSPAREVSAASVAQVSPSKLRSTECRDEVPRIEGRGLSALATGVSGTGMAAIVAHPQQIFDGRPVRIARIVRMRVTAYSPDARSCGSSADGITASGYSVATNGGALVAADPSVLALGSLVAVPGYEQGAVVPVLDIGGAIKGNRLDVLFPTHEAARRWGVRDLDVVVYEYDDGKPNGFRKFPRRS